LKDCYKLKAKEKATKKSEKPDEEVRKSVQTLGKSISYEIRPVLQPHRKKTYVHLESPFLKENPAPFLLDTGAEVSVLPIESLLYSKVECIQIQENPETLMAIDGELHCLGIIFLPVILNGEKYDFRFHVVRQQDLGALDNGILGNNILQATKADIKNSTMKLQLTTLNVDLPLYTTRNRRLQKLLDLEQSSTTSEELPELVQPENIQHNEPSHIQAFPEEAENQLPEEAENQIPEEAEKPLPNRQQMVQVLSKDAPTKEEERVTQVISKLRIDHIPTSQKEDFHSLIAKHSQDFFLKDDPLPLHHTKFQHEIDLTDEKPIYVRSYRFPACHRAEVEKQTADLLQRNIIRESKSPWNFPIWIVPKKKDASQEVKYRMVIDYRKLNLVTVSSVFPIPLI
jgi:hypothetical protein